MISQFMTREFLIFLLAGGISAVFNFVSRIFYSLWLDFAYSIFFAYITGMVIAFLLFKLFVFDESNQSAHRSVVFFVLVNMVGLTQTWGISMGLAHYLLPAFGVSSYVHEIAHAVGLGSTAFTSYIGHKKFSFK